MKVKTMKEFNTFEEVWKILRWLIPWEIGMYIYASLGGGLVSLFLIENAVVVAICYENAGDKVKKWKWKITRDDLLGVGAGVWVFYLGIGFMALVRNLQYSPISMQFPFFFWGMLIKMAIIEVAILAGGRSGRKEIKKK